MACPHVKPYINAEWGDPAVDCSGQYAAINAAAGRVVHWDCDYAHTLLELMYHPQVFKTQLCVAAGSVVTMGCGGGLEVARVKVGDVVMAWDAEQGGLMRTEVLGVIEREDEKECVELAFEDGRTLRCTPDHRLLTTNGEWVEAQLLAVGESRVQTSSIPSLLFPSSELETDEGQTWQMRLCGDDRYHFSTADRSSCLRLCALARLAGLLVVAAMEVSGEDDDEATWQCGLRRATRLDAERLVADLELLSGETVESAESDEGFLVIVPPSLLAALHECHGSHNAPVDAFSDNFASLHPLLVSNDAPDWAHKECMATLLGGLSVTEAGVDTANGDLQLTFALRSDQHSVTDAMHSVINSVCQRLQIDVLLDSKSDSDNQLQRLFLPFSAMQRIGVRYNARLEAQLSKLTSATSSATLDSPTDDVESSGTSTTTTCYSLAVSSRHACGRLRVFDLQVDSRLHSFVANGVVVHNCDHFRQNDPHSWKCVWKRRCAHAHGHADLNTKEQAMEGWRQHLALIGAINAADGDGHTQSKPHPSPLLLPSAQHSEEGGQAAVMRPLLSRWSEDVADESAWAREKQVRGERERRASLPLPSTTKGCWSEHRNSVDKVTTYSPYSGVQQASTHKVRLQATSPLALFIAGSLSQSTHCELYSACMFSVSRSSI